MGSPDPNARGRTFRTARAAAFSALFLLPLPACHGRPLVSQMAHARDSASDRTRVPSGRQRRASQSLELLDGRSRLANPANRMKAEDFRRIAQEMARRDAGSPRSHRPQTPERAALAGVLAHPAAPSWQDPTKAFLPGELCVDPIALTVLVVRALIQRGNRPPGD